MRWEEFEYLGKLYGGTISQIEKQLLLGENECVDVRVAQVGTHGSICGTIIWNLMICFLMWKLERDCNCCGCACEDEQCM